MGRELTTADRNALLRLADNLDGAERLGAEKDQPEGLRYVMLSDTLVRQISADLRRVAQP